MRSLFVAIMAFAVFAAAAPSSVQAQSRTTSAIRGRVYGTNEAPLLGALVTVRQTDTGAERTGLTNQQGAFLILLLAPGGPYTLTVQNLGYTESSVEQIAVSYTHLTLPTKA